MPIGTLGILKPEFEPYDPNVIFGARIHAPYTNFIQDSPYGQKVVKQLSDDPRVTEMVGKLIAHGTNPVHFNLHDLARWFVWCVNEYDEATAQVHLEAWLASDQITVLNALWLTGIHPESKIEIGGEYTIRRIDEMPISNEMEYFLAGRQNFLASENLPKCALTAESKMPKVWRIGEPDNAAAEYFANCAKLYEVANLLNALPGVVCVPYLLATYTPPTIPTGHFGPSSSRRPVRDVAGDINSPITDSDCQAIGHLLANYGLRTVTEKKRIQRALSRISQAKRRRQVEDKVLDLGISLEMLLLDDNQKDQLALQFRLRGSWLVGQTIKERVETYELLKKLYEARSSVAHTGALNESKGSAIGDDELRQFTSLTETVVQKIITDGSPNWRDLLLGGAPPTQLPRQD